MRKKAPGRPRDAGVNEAILDATIRTLARDGFGRLTFEKVAEEAGTSRPTIYRRYANKSELAVAAIRHIRGPLPVAISGDVYFDLVSELRAFRERVSLPFAMTMVGTVLAEEFHQPELLALYRQQMVRPRRERIKKVLALVPGLDKGTADQAELIDDATTMVIGAYYAHYLQRGHVDKRWPERMARILLQGLLCIGAEARKPPKEGAPGHPAKKVAAKRGK